MTLWSPLAQSAVEDWLAGMHDGTWWAIDPHDVREINRTAKTADVPDRVNMYRIYVSDKPEGPFTQKMLVPAGEAQATVEKLERGKPVYFQVTAVGPEKVESAPAVLVAPVTPTRQAFGTP